MGCVIVREPCKTGIAEVLGGQISQVTSSDQVTEDNNAAYHLPAVEDDVALSHLTTVRPSADPHDIFHPHLSNGATNLACNPLSQDDQGPCSKGSNANSPKMNKMPAILAMAINTPLFSPSSSDVHAEMNALAACAKKGVCTQDTTAYISMPPCKNCFMLLQACGVRRIVTRKPFFIERVTDAAVRLGIELVVIPDDEAADARRKALVAAAAPGSVDHPHITTTVTGETVAMVAPDMTRICDRLQDSLASSNTAEVTVINPDGHSGSNPHSTTTSRETKRIRKEE
jgi:hypothetical protein